MAQRGPKPKGKVKIRWSSDFAYALGLFATDGCLSGSERHIIFVSKDVEQLQNFIQALRIEVPISYTLSGFTGKKIPRIQFGDVLFCDFLKSIGFTSNKTKTIGKIDIPDKYFFDFLRGHMDGDGCTYSYWDSRWKSSFMFYTTFVSASRSHIDWIQGQIERLAGVHGHISYAKKGTVFQLRYAKKESLVLLKKLYPSRKVRCLSRKRLKIEKTLRIVGESLSTNLLTSNAQVLKLVDITA